MEEDILKYSPTVMFRGTPCIPHLFDYNLSIIRSLSKIKDDH